MVHKRPPELIPLTDGPSILLDKPNMLLGRHQECDIQLNSRKVSRRHCCLAQVNDYLVVRDLCSTNGIRINGQKVLEGKLRPGHELIIGNFQFVIRWPGHPDQPDSSLNGKSIPQSSESEDNSEIINPNNPPDSSERENPHLDSCEHPVALADPDESQSSKKSEATDKNPQKNIEDQPPSFILPENIDYAPSSDSFHREG